MHLLVLNLKFFINYFLKIIKFKDDLVIMCPKEIMDHYKIRYL